MNTTKEISWVDQHRAIWDRKPALRWYYKCEQYERINAQIVCEPILEIGAGPAFLARNLGRPVIASDVDPHEGIDVCADVHSLPFASATFGAVAAVDVLHHLARPRHALAEIARVLKPGGRCVMVEPWGGALSAFVLKWFHHEHYVAVEDPWNAAMPVNKAPMEGNTWISKALLADRATELPIQVPGLTVTRIEPFGILSYLGSGGFQAWSLPRWICQLSSRVESILPAPLLSVLSFRVLLVLQKRD